MEISLAPFDLIGGEMLDLLRTLFRIRKTRQVPSSGPMPKLGSTLVRQGVKMKVSQPMDPELWDWLQLSGWRVSTVRNDRRKSIVLPSDAMARLLAVDADERGKVHAQLISVAEGSANGGKR